MKKILLILSFLLAVMVANCQDFFGGYSFGVPTLEIDYVGWYNNLGGECSQITGGASKKLNGKGSIITEYGFVASRSTSSPTISDYQKKITYTSVLKNESSFYFYNSSCNFDVGWWYIRLYAINCDGVGYSEVYMGLTEGETITIPTISTTATTNILISSVTSGGNVTDDGGALPSERGVVIGTSVDPTITTYTQKIIDSGSGTGSFVSNISGLDKNTTYYIRAYAINSVGVGYGDNVSFRTLNQLQPTLQTNLISSITTTSATSGGNAVFDGNAPIIEKGICYKIGSTPISTDNTINNGSGSGDFTSNMTGLSPNTEYHVRAWARNSFTYNGFTYYVLGYGQEEIFTTLPSTAILPTLATISASPIQSTYAFSGGIITGAGTNLITDRGVCYGTSTNPTISNSFVSSGVGQTGSYTTYLSPLSPSTLYYARAYATTIDGTAYGNQISFTTTASTPSCTVPVLATNSITSITTNSATSGGVISSDGGCSITAKGTQWSLDSGFSTIAGSTSDGTGTGSFTSSIAGLNCGTTYYVRSYATNTAGTGYGSTVSFITNSSATVSIASFSAITSTSFTANCSVTSSCSNITSRGIIYSTSSGVTYPTNAQACGSGTGTFDCSPYATLSANTTYYVKAYAIINGGSIYLSTESTVTTLPTSNPCTLAIGDSYGGGIVAYIFQSGDIGYVSGECHGIISSASDQSTGAYFGCYGSNLSGASSMLLKGGEQNTIDIVTGCSDSGISAKLCYDYSYGSYSDWWLPSLNELLKLYENRVLIGGFDTSAAYSSSSEVDAYSVYSVNFVDGSYSVGSNTKLYPFHVRAIRYF